MVASKLFGYDVMKRRKQGGDAAPSRSNPALRQTAARLLDRPARAHFGEVESVRATPDEVRLKGLDASVQTAVEFHR
jgi:hypothetical protein